VRSSHPPAILRACSRVLVRPAVWRMRSPRAARLSASQRWPRDPSGVPSSRGVPVDDGRLRRAELPPVSLRQPGRRPTGHLAVSGVPDAYAAGSEYVLKIALRRPGLSRGASRSRRGRLRPPRRLAGRQVVAGDDRVQVVRDPDHPSIDYAQHTTTGTRAAGEGELAWTVRWIAPERAGDQVVFHVAANAANDDASSARRFHLPRRGTQCPQGSSSTGSGWPERSRRPGPRPPTSRLRLFVEVRRSLGEGGKAQGVP